MIRCLPALCFFVTFLAFSQNNKKAFLDSRGQFVYVKLGTQAFADKVVEFRVGEPASTGVHANTDACLGPPDFVHWQEPGSLSLGCGGELIVEFTDNALVNLPGNDLYIFETGPAVEPIEIAISKDGFNWVEIGKISGGATFIDLEGIIEANDAYYFVRLVDLKTDCHNNGVDGADIDAIAAMGSVPTKGLCAHIDACALPKIKAWQYRRLTETHREREKRLTDSLQIIEAQYYSNCTFNFANNIFEADRFKFSYNKTKAEATLFYKNFEAYTFNLSRKDAATFENEREDVMISNPAFGVNCNNDKLYIISLDIEYPINVEPDYEQLADELIVPEVITPQPVVDIKATYPIKNASIDIEVWDNGQQDGDTISVYFNNELVIDKQLVTKQKRTLTLNLNEGDNKLVLIAENLGTIPPNTAAFKIRDGRKVRMVVLNSDFGTSEAVILRRE